LTTIDSDRPAKACEQFMAMHLAVPTVAYESIAVAKAAPHHRIIASKMCLAGAGGGGVGELISLQALRV